MRGKKTDSLTHSDFWAELKIDVQYLDKSSCGDWKIEIFDSFFSLKLNFLLNKVIRNPSSAKRNSSKQLNLTVLTKMNSGKCINISYFRENIFSQRFLPVKH